MCWDLWILGLWVEGWKGLGFRVKVKGILIFPFFSGYVMEIRFSWRVFSNLSEILYYSKETPLCTIYIHVMLTRIKFHSNPALGRSVP